jgi:hypothetical protein
MDLQNGWVFVAMAEGALLLRIRVICTQAAVEDLQERFRIGEAGLLNEFIGAEFEALFPGLFLDVGGADDHRRLAGELRILGKKLETAQPGHEEVADHEIGLNLLAEPEPLLSVGGFENLEIPGQDLAVDLACEKSVINDQYFHFRLNCPNRRSIPGGDPLGPVNISISVISILYIDPSPGFLEQIH